MQKIKIGEVELKNNLILAPMAGFTNPSFRRLTAEFGAGLTVTEMVSVKGLLYNNAKTAELLATSGAEAVKCVQLFGKEPEDFYRCARLNALQKFDIIDVNMGCPVKKIVNNGEGSALMGDWRRAADIVCALKSGGKSVTVKTRLGINNTGEILEFGVRLSEAGADMLSVHCRTAKQMYAGQADYSVIPLIKKQINIPVAVNGDIKDLLSFKRAKETGADAFMIGRGALYDPFIFLKILGDLPCITKKEAVYRLIDYICSDEGEQQAVVNLRKFLPYFVKGAKISKEEKHRLNFIKSAKELKESLDCI